MRDNLEVVYLAPGSGLQSGLRLLGDRAERGRVADGEVGEHLPVELDPGRSGRRDEILALRDEQP